MDIDIQVFKLHVCDVIVLLLAISLASSWALIKAATRYSIF